MCNISNFNLAFILSFQAAMSRLRITKLTVSHPYIHKRLDDFGKDHDADIMECVALESKRLQVRCLKAEGQNSREEKPQMQKDTNAQSDADASHRIMASWEKLKMEITGETESFDRAGMCEVINFTPSQDVVDATIIKDVVSSLVTRVAQKVENGESDSCDKDVGSALVSKRPVLASFTDMGRKQVFDNIDYQQTVHHMTEEHQNELHHWTSYMSTENRISGNHLPDIGPQGRLKDMENGKCIPDRLEHRIQRQNYVHLVSRICSQNILCLKFLSSVIPKHIPRHYSEQMSKPTKTVS